ncbi:uncharacterized protein [Cardiocondyla obscurior]|uniref:uncharacterized protein n=1 Tax=Cardiocondyla obscurior TaxID=286306 RepID=UPI00396584E0
MAKIRTQELCSMREEWKHQLEACSASGGGHRIVSANLPFMEDWLEYLNNEGPPDFYTSQILLGHGVFGEFLHKINKEETPRCWKCRAARHTADYTLQDCGAFMQNRLNLRNEIGNNLNLNEIIPAIINNDKTRRIFYAF